MRDNFFVVIAVDITKTFCVAMNSNVRQRTQNYGSKEEGGTQAGKAQGSSKAQACKAQGRKEDDEARTSLVAKTDCSLSHF
jgi:hypothetical protein